MTEERTTKRAQSERQPSQIEILLRVEKQKPLCYETLLKTKKTNFNTFSVISSQIFRENRRIARGTAAKELGTDVCLSTKLSSITNYLLISYIMHLLSCQTTFQRTQRVIERVSFSKEKHLIMGIV